MSVSLDEQTRITVQLRLSVTAPWSPITLQKEIPAVKQCVWKRASQRDSDCHCHQKSWRPPTSLHTQHIHTHMDWDSSVPVQHMTPGPKQWDY